MRIKNIVFYSCTMFFPIHAMEYKDEPCTATVISRESHKVYDKCMAFSTAHNTIFEPSKHENCVKIVSEGEFRLRTQFLYWSDASAYATTAKDNTKLVLPSARYAPIKAPCITKKAVYNDRNNLFFVAHGGDYSKALFVYAIDTTNEAQMDIKQKTLLSKKEPFSITDITILPEYGLATVSRGKEVKIWDVATASHARILKLDEPSSHIVSFSPHTFLTTENCLIDEDECVHEWDARTQFCVQNYETPYGLQAIIATPNGFLSGGYDWQKEHHVIQEWENKTGTVLRSYEVKSASFQYRYDVPLSIRGLGYYQNYVIALIQEAQKGYVKIWDNTSQNLVQQECIDMGKTAINLPRDCSSLKWQSNWSKERPGVVGSLLTRSNGEFWVINENNIVKLSLSSTT